MCEVTRLDTFKTKYMRRNRVHEGKWIEVDWTHDERRKNDEIMNKVWEVLTIR